MAAYDEDIQLTVGLEPGDVIGTAEKLNDEIRKIFESASGEALSTQFKSLLAQMSKVTDKSQQLQTKLQDLGSSTVVTPIYEEYEKALDKLAAKREEIRRRMDKMDFFNVSPKSKSYQKVLYDYEQTEEAIKKLNDEMRDLRGNNEAFMSGANTDQYKQGINSLNALNNQMIIYKERLDQLNGEQSDDNFVTRFVERLQLTDQQIRSVGNTIVETFSNIMAQCATQGASIMGNTFAKEIQVGFNAVITGAQKVASIAGSAFEGLRTVISKVSSGVVSIGKSAFSGMADGAKKAVESINNLRTSLSQLAGNAIKSGLDKIKTSLSGIGKSAGNSNNGLNKGLKFFMRYGLGVRSTFALVRKLRRALGEGFENLARSNSEFNAAMSQIKTSIEWIKNNVAAAFAPLIEVAAPIIESLAEKLVYIIQLVGQFIAAITGKQVIQADKVYQDYAQSLDKGTKSLNKGTKATKKLNKEAKELEKTLAGFDDVQLLKTDKDSVIDPEEELEDALEPSYSFAPGKIDAGILDLVDRIKKYFKDLWDVVKRAWEQEGAKLIESAKRALQAIKDLLLTIAKTFHDVFVDGYGFDWLVSLFQLLQTIFDIITAIATEFKRAWEDDGRGYNLIASIFTLLTQVNNLLKDIGQSFIDAWNSGSGYELIAAILELFTEINIMLTAIAVAIRIAWNENNTGYELIKMILDLFTIIASTLTDIADAFGRAFVSDVGITMISNILELFTTILNVLYVITAAFQGAWNDNEAGYKYVISLFTALGEVFELLNSIGTAFINAWEKGKRGQTLLASLLGLFTVLNILVATVATVFKNAWEDNGRGEEVIGGLVDLFNDILGILTDITNNFATAFNSQEGYDLVASLLETFYKISGTIKTIATRFRLAWNDKDAGLDLITSIFEKFTAINTTLGEIAGAFKRAWEQEDTIDSVFTNIFEALTKWEETQTKVINSLGTSFEEGGTGEQAIASITSLFDGIIKTIGDIEEAFNNAWDKDGQGQRTVDGLFSSVKGIAEELDSISLSFNDVWNDGGNGEKLVGEVLTVFEKIELTIGNISSAFQTAWNDNGNGKTLVGDILGVFTDILTTISTITTDYAKTFEDGGSGEQAIRSILEALDEVIGTIESIELAFDQAWQDDQLGKQYIDSIHVVIKDINTALGETANSFKTAWEEGGAGKELFESLLESVTHLNEYLGSVADAFGSAFSSTTGTEAFSALISDANELIGLLGDIAEDFSKSFSDGSGKQMVQDIVGLLRTAFTGLGYIATAFREAWDDDGLGLIYINSIHATVDSFITLFDSVGQAAVKAWHKNNTGKTIIRAILDYVTNINRIFGNLAISIKKAWDEGNRGESIFEKIEGFIANCAEDSASITESFATWAENLDFGPLLQSFDSLLEKLEPIGEIVNGAIRTAYTEVLQPLAKWTIEKGLPGVLESLGTALELVGNVINTAKPAFEFIWDNIIKPLAEDTGIIVIGALKLITNALSGLSDWISNHSELVVNFVKIFGRFITMWFISSSIISIIKGVGIALGGIIGAINPLIVGIAAVSAAVALLVTHWDDVTTAVGNAIEKVKEFFTVSEHDLTVAIEDLPEKTQEVITDLIDALRRYIDNVEDAPDALNDLISTLVTYNGTTGKSVEIINTVREGLINAGVNTEEFQTILSRTGGTSISAQAVLYGLKDATQEVAGSMDTATDAVEKTGNKVAEAETDFNNLVTQFQESSTAYNQSADNINNALESIENTTETATTGAQEDWETFIKETTSDIDQLQSEIDGNDGISKVTTDFGNTTKDVLDETAKIWEDTKKEVSSEIKETAKSVTDNSDTMKKNITSDNDSIQKDSDTQWKLVKSRTIKYFNELVTSVKEKSYDLSSDVKYIFQLLATNIPEQFNGVGTDIASRFDGVSDLINDKFSNLPDLMYLRGQDMARSLVDGFKSIYIPTPHMRISAWDEHDNGNGGIIVTPQFAVDWYARGGFPKRGQLFVGNENGIEAMGKMGNRNVVANNQQIIEGIKNGVIDAMHTVLTSLSSMGTRLNLSTESLSKFTELNGTLNKLSQYAAPLVAQGRLLPSTATMTNSMTNSLSNILDELRYQSNDTITIDELRPVLIDICRNYISSTTYIGDEQVARSANRGNLQLNRILGQA